jgi:membrane peptidoglycan carboxypeptidase
MTLRIRKWLAVAAALFLVAAVAVVAQTVVNQQADVNAVMLSDQASDTLVYDRTGTVLLADIQVADGVQHVDVPLTAMGRWLPAATVAVEDPGFWNEPGIDAGRLARASWDGITGRSGGDTGGTIVTRLIRLRMGTAVGPRTAALAVRVAATFPKARILQSYLNSLPYGNRAVGVEAAAITYFQVDATQLDLAQAALIAGLPEAPTRLDPLRDREAAKERQRQVLDAMVRTHAVTAEEAARALAEPLRLVGPAPLNVAPKFVSMVLADLSSRYGGVAQGSTVITTLDWGLQQLAAASLRRAVDANASRRVTAGSLAAIDPHTGQVLALADHGEAASTRSPGTAFRMFTYASAIASGRYTMVTPVEDSPFEVTTGDGEPAYRPHNYDRLDHGPCELRTCAGGGLNLPAIRVEMSLGVPAVVETARALGAPPLVPHFAPDGSATFSTDDPPSSFGPSLTLGGYGATPLQMATGAATLAAAGARRQPSTILRAGEATATLDQGKRVVDAGAAYVVTQMLSDDADRVRTYGGASALTLPGRHAAAIAGTTETFSDGWTVGYTPSLAVAVWTGNADYSAMLPGSDGVIVAAPAWRQFMQGALDQLGRTDEWYAPPTGLEAITVNGRTAWFLPGTSPSTPPPPLPASVHPVA